MKTPSKVIKIKTTAYTRASHRGFVGIFGTIISAILGQTDVFTSIPFLPAFLLERVQAISDKTCSAVLGSTEQKNERDAERTRCEKILTSLSSAVIDRALLEDT